MDKIEQAIFRAQAHSPYLRALIAQFPDIVEMVRAGAAPGGLDAKLPVPKRLRMAKRRLALHVGLADLAGIMSLEVVMRQLSDFADAALDVALEAAFAAVVPGQPPQGFAILALGKQGSHELNYSSDIDPIFIFDPETLPRRSKDEPIETAIRIARHLLDTMQTRDADGYVLRVDMRLRPYPEATALAVPLEAAIRYYESAAEPWERAAFIRARACAGDVALGQNFLQVIQPFIWRRALDFGVRTEIDAIVSRIRDHAEDRQAFGPGFDLKRGHGGIREVEFYAQIHQLIHGGRDPALRVGATLDALAVLERAGRIAPDEAARLAAAYRIYRSIEHRLQMVNDQQTHRLPLDEAALENVAHLHGLKSGAALLELLAPHVDAVGAIFDTMTPRTPGAFPRDGAHIEQALKALGFKQRGDVARRISGWRSGKYRTVRSAAARAGLEAVLPALLKAFAACAAPLTAINRFDQMLEGLPSAVNLFALLNAQPPLLDMLVRILSLAPALSEELARRANLLDGLIDASALAPLPDVAALVAALAHPDVQADLEMVLERVRLLVGEKRFALGVQIILGISDPLEVARGYARLAEAAVHVITACVVRGYEQVHGRVAGSELLILALGRLGGGELTHKSDLDLVFIFTGDYRGTSDGRQPLGAMHYFNRLTQRVIAALSVATASGRLYEVDTRLRPSGPDGELCVSLAGFSDYHLGEAWTWETMALTRARAIYGTQAARAQADAALDAVFAQPRDPEKIQADATEMRAMITENKAASGPLDVKLHAGGLVDIEFLVATRLLIQGGRREPDLHRSISLAGLGEELGAACTLMTRLLIVLRLLESDTTLSRAARCVVLNASGANSWPALLKRLEAAYQRVRADPGASLTSG